MGGKWLVRGAAAVVVAVLAGAWTVGVAGVGDSGKPGPPTEERIIPPSPDGSVEPEVERRDALNKVRPPKVREAAETPDAVPDPGADPGTGDEPAEVAPSTPVPTTPVPTPDAPASLEEPPDPPQPPAPSDPPSEPSDECTDILDCVLNPITAQP